MFERNRELTSRLVNARLDVMAGLLGLFLAVCMFPLRFLSSQIFIRTLPIVLGVGCILYLLAVRGNRSDSALPTIDSWFAQAAPSVILFGLAAMVLIAAVDGRRSQHFYDVAGIVGTILLGQILLLRERDLHPGVILGQILAFGFVLRFAGLYTWPGFIGVDVWSHITYVREIMRQGSLSAISDSKYVASPFFHLLVTVASGFYDLSVRNALYLTLGIAMPLSTLLVYGATRLIVSMRWAFFATACYMMADHSIRWGIHIIPTSLGLVFFLAMLFALLRNLQAEHETRDFLVLVIFSVAIIMTHQITAFIMLVLVGSGFFSQLLLSLDFIRLPRVQNPFASSLPKPVNLMGLLAFDIGFITFMWSLTPYGGETFLETMLSYLYHTLINTAGFLNGVSSGSAGGTGIPGNGPGTELIATLEIYMRTVGFLLLIWGSVMGCLAVLRRRRATHATFTLLVSVVVMLFFVLGLPLFGIDVFIPARWIAFLYAPMVILTAIGLRHLSRNVSRGGVVIAVLLVFALIFPSVMVMSSDGTPDSPVFPTQHERLAYTESELTAVRTIGDVTSKEGPPLYTDYPYITVFYRTDTHPAKAITLKNGYAVQSSFVVYREYQSDGGSVFRFVGTNATARRNVPLDHICPGSTSYVYSNGNVIVCRSLTTGG